MYKNILIPVALEPEGDLSTALTAAKALIDEGGAVSLLHVVEDVPAFVAAHFAEAEGASARHREAAQAKLDEIASGAGFPVRAHVTSGHASRTILDEAEAIGADCIIISSHKPGLGDYLIGSHAARVVRHSKCAVLVVR